MTSRAAPRRRRAPGAPRSPRPRGSAPPGGARGPGPRRRARAPRRPRGRLAGASATRSSGRSRAAGSRKRISVPSPGVESISICAAGVGDDAVHGREPQAGALAVGLVVKNGSKARSATSGDHARRRRRARRPRRRSPGASHGDRQRAAVGHRVARVDREVHEHLLDLRAVGEDGRQRRGSRVDARAARARRASARAATRARATSTPRSSTSGVTTSRRLNISSWRVSAAARSAARPISATSS